MHLVFLRVNWSWECRETEASSWNSKIRREKKINLSEKKKLYKFGLKNKIIGLIITGDNFYCIFYMSKYNICHFDMK